MGRSLYVLNFKVKIGNLIGFYISMMNLKPLRYQIQRIYEDCAYYSDNQKTPIGRRLADSSCNF